MKVFSWLFSVIAVFIFLTAVSWAWNNPTANPPEGGGTISVDASYVTYVSGLLSVGGRTNITGDGITGQVLNIFGADRYWSIGQGGSQFPTSGFGIRDLTRNDTVFAIDSAGSVSVKGILDLLVHRIINLADPVDATDAATKDYVDKNGAVGGSSARQWGEGRPNVAVVTAAGECVVNGLKASRSNVSVSWDSTPSACPAGWWVCKKSERGTGICQGSGQPVGFKGIGCSGTANTYEQFWVADMATVDPDTQGKAIHANHATVETDAAICQTRRAWCCANQ